MTPIYLSSLAIGSPLPIYPCIAFYPSFQNFRLGPNFRHHWLYPFPAPSLLYTYFLRLKVPWFLITHVLSTPITVFQMYLVHPNFCYFTQFTYFLFPKTDLPIFHGCRFTVTYLLVSYFPILTSISPISGPFILFGPSLPILPVCRFPGTHLPMCFPYFPFLGSQIYHPVFSLLISCHSLTPYYPCFSLPCIFQITSDT